MAFNAQVKFDGDSYNILNCNYALHQETDATGRPSSITRGGKVTITVESTGDTKISDWAMDSYQMKSLEVNFEKRDTKATAKVLKINDAYLVKFQENFDSTGQNPMTITFTVSAREISIGNGDFVNEWVM